MSDGLARRCPGLGLNGRGSGVAWRGDIGRRLGGSAASRVKRRVTGDGEKREAKANAANDDQDDADRLDADACDVVANGESENRTKGYENETGCSCNDNPPNELREPGDHP